MRLKNHLIVGGAVVALSALALTGCSPSSTSNSSTSGTGSLTVAKPDGSAVLATQINNPFITTGSGMSLGYDRMIYEPLAMVNPVGKNETTPWLASKVKWNSDYTQLTVTPRANVKWSDGKPFTADDIVFTFNMIKSTPALDLAGLKLSDIKKDGDNVVMTFSESKFVKQGDVLQTAIVPEHLWKDIKDPSKDPVKDAVGTGPYTIGPGQGRRRHGPIHDQQLLVAGRRPQGSHRLLGRQGSRRHAEVPRVQRQHRSASRPAERRDRLGPDLHHRLPEELRRQGPEAQRFLGRQYPQPGHDRGQHDSGSVRQRGVPQGGEHGRRPQSPRREGPKQCRPRTDERLGHPAADG
jgi:hypothetical protein